MRIKLSLEETLINAISQGRIRGVQFKKAWSDERATFEDLRKIIEDHKNQPDYIR